jgi:hypothetical protein
VADFLWLHCQTSGNCMIKLSSRPSTRVRVDTPKTNASQSHIQGFLTPCAPNVASVNTTTAQLLSASDAGLPFMSSAA